VGSCSATASAESAEDQPSSTASELAQPPSPPPSLELYDPLATPPPSPINASTPHPTVPTSWNGEF